MEFRQFFVLSLPRGEYDVKIIVHDTSEGRDWQCQLSSQVGSAFPKSAQPTVPQGAYSKWRASKAPSAHVFLDQMPAHKFWLGKDGMPSGNPAPQLYHCRSHSCTGMSSTFSVSASPFLASAVPYSSPSVYFHAMSPHVSLHSWTKHSDFFIVRKKSVLSNRGVNTNANLTGRWIFMDQIVPTSHALR